MILALGVFSPVLSQARGLMCIKCGCEMSLKIEQGEKTLYKTEDCRCTDYWGEGYFKHYYYHQYDEHIYTCPECKQQRTTTVEVKYPVEHVRQ